jgi:hypothetical protein
MATYVLSGAMQKVAHFQRHVQILRTGSPKTNDAKHPDASL